MTVETPLKMCVKRVITNKLNQNDGIHVRNYICDGEIVNNLRLFLQILRKRLNLRITLWLRRSIGLPLKGIRKVNQ